MLRTAAGPVFVTWAFVTWAFLAFSGGVLWGQTEQLERRVLELSNQERQRHRLPALRAEDTLAYIARGHSSDMLYRGYFSHQNPQGESVADRVAASHRRLVGVSGENIWSGSGHDAGDVESLARTIVDSWMQSPGHRRNILREDYSHLGVGIAADGKEIRATQVFGGIVAYLRTPLPETLHRGDEPDLSLDMVDRGRQPAELFALWSPRRGKDVTQPRPIRVPQLDAETGTYRLRFYFPDRTAGKYKLFFGPRFVLR